MPPYSRETAAESAAAVNEAWRLQSLLGRTRLATRLARDFEINASGVALALDLLDEIEALRARLRRMAGGGR